MAGGGPAAAGQSAAPDGVRPCAAAGPGRAAGRGEGAVKLRPLPAAVGSVSGGEAGCVWGGGVVRESAGRASRFSGKGEGGEVKRAGGTHGCGGAAVEPGSPRCPRHRCDPRRAQFRGGETCRGGTQSYAAAQTPGTGWEGEWERGWCCAAETGQAHRIFRGSLLLHTVGPTGGSG